MKKVNTMASDKIEKLWSAMDKLQEFADLGYPVRDRREACAILAVERDKTVWGLVGVLQR